MSAFTPPAGDPVRGATGSTTALSSDSDARSGTVGGVSQPGVERRVREPVSVTGIVRAVVGDPNDAAVRLRAVDLANPGHDLCVSVMPVCEKINHARNATLQQTAECPV